MTEIRVPNVGESISEVRVARWLKSPGQAITKDEDLVELETDKASVTVPAPESGVLGEILKRAGESAQVGEALAKLEERPAGKRLPREAEGKAEQAAAPPRPTPAPPRREERPEPSASEQGRAPEPAPARRPEGNGARGKTLVTERRAKPEAPAPAQPEARARAAAPARSEERVAMSPLRKAAAERLVAAQRQAALLSTFNEVDLSAVQEARRRYRPAFEERHGVKLGLMSFFVKAAIAALKATPELNAMIEGDEIVYRRYYDIGIAVSGGKGLVVPVLRDADRMTFVDLERDIDDFGRRARENRIRPEDLTGGTFTITNGGVFGSLLSTPIVNPPQSGILGMHAVQERPVARNGEVVVRPMMYVALSYDHRIVDGREAVTFLKRIKEVVEDPVRLLLQV